MKRITRFNPMTDRYAFDFGACSYQNGYAQIDTSQDASYYGTWTSPTERKIVSYCEGDITIQIADDATEYVEAIRELARWIDDIGYGPMKIDAMCVPEMAAAFDHLGLGDLLH